MPLSTAAQRLLQYPDRNLPANDWFVSFYARHPEVEEKRPKAKEKSRVYQHTESTIRRYYHGGAGVTQELIAAGIMDATTMKIIPGMEHRVINRDETPQFFDYNDTKGGGQQKHATGAGDPAVKPSSVRYRG